MSTIVIPERRVLTRSRSRPPMSPPRPVLGITAFCGDVLLVDGEVAKVARRVQHYRSPSVLLGLAHPVTGKRLGGIVCTKDMVLTLLVPAPEGRDAA